MTCPRTDCTRMYVRRAARGWSTLKIRSRLWDGGRFRSSDTNHDREPHSIKMTMKTHFSYLQSRKRTWPALSSLRHVSPCKHGRCTCRAHGFLRRLSLTGPRIVMDGAFSSPRPPTLIKVVCPFASSFGEILSFTRKRRQGILKKTKQDLSS